MQGILRAGPEALRCRFGAFQFYAEQRGDDGERVVALIAGSPAAGAAPLVRIHSQCLTGDVFGSLRCDCGRQLSEALSRIAASGWGILIYQMQEGCGIGLINKLRAYELQDSGMDTVEAILHMGFAADLRTYSFAAAMLRSLGARQIRLLSNNPAKIRGLEAENIEVMERIPLYVATSEFAAHYMRTKRDKLGHLL